MKKMQQIINNLTNSNKYSIQTANLLKMFLPFEIDVTQDQADKIIEVALDYLESYFNIEFIDTNNTSDWEGRLSHDFYYLIYKSNDKYYVLIEVKVNSELKYNERIHNGYSDAFLLEFNEYEEFLKLLEETEKNATFQIEVDNKHYIVTPQMHNKELKVHCIEDNVDISDIFAMNDKEFILQIQTLLKFQIKDCKPNISHSI